MDMSRQKQAQQMRTGKGFIAALDQSGGSTPKALGLYGIGADAYANDAEMFQLIHAMRARIATAPAFTGDKVIGAILFERTMNEEIGGKPSAQYLWEDRGVVPFLKVDQGLQDASEGVKLMKPIAGLDALLKRANEAGIFGTKMRSVIDAASRPGIAANVEQQFAIAGQILDQGLMPIIEPEVTISIADKAAAEDILRDELLRHLDALPADRQVMLKLTLPSADNHYLPVIDHPNVMRVVALSGGYSRDEANALLAKNKGMIASFSRALSEGLSAQQDDADFNRTIAATIKSICDASNAG
jgi:fructose-bisphosphate aldolase class I